MRRFTTRQIAVTGLLGALTIALGLLPVGGFIPVPTPAGNATTMHIPTIIAGIVEGPVVGGLVGLIFGGFSFWRAQTQANPVAKSMFSDPLLAFLPRFFIGVVAYYAYRLAHGSHSRIAAAILVGITSGYTTYSAIGQLSTNFPILKVWGAVLGVLFGGLLGFGVHSLLSRDATGPVLGALAGTAVNTLGVLSLAVLRGYMPAVAAVGVAVLHGLPEMLVAAVLVTLIYRGLLRSNIIHRPDNGFGKGY